MITLNSDICICFGTNNVKKFNDFWNLHLKMHSLILFIRKLAIMYLLCMWFVQKVTVSHQKALYSYILDGLWKNYCRSCNRCLEIIAWEHRYYFKNFAIKPSIILTHYVKYICKRIFFFTFLFLNFYFFLLLDAHDELWWEEEYCFVSRDI